jgi:hypothetical protein
MRQNTERRMMSIEYEVGQKGESLICWLTEGRMLKETANELIGCEAV